MKEYLKKHFIKILIVFTIIFSFILIMIWKSNEKYGLICDDVIINIVPDKNMEALYNNEYIIKKINPLIKSAKNKIISKENLQNIETQISLIKSVKRVSVYEQKNFIIADVTPRNPIAIIFNLDKRSYFIDEEFNLFESEDILKNILVVSSDIDIFNKKYNEYLQNLYELIKYIQNDDFLKNQIHQINFSSNFNVILAPLVGYHHIILGPLDDFTSKLIKLKDFYKKSIRKLDLNEYKTINLSFFGQVVCEKK